MMAWLVPESSLGLLHKDKDLTSASKVPQAPACAGLPVDYMDPVPRHIRTTSAYGGYNQLVKSLNLLSSIASSPAKLGKLTGKKVVMHMHNL